MKLTVDPNAPTKLSPELSKKVADGKRVLQLNREGKALTEKIKRKYIISSNVLLRMIYWLRPRDIWIRPYTVNETDCSRKPGSDISETPT